MKKVKLEPIIAGINNHVDHFDIKGSILIENGDNKYLIGKAATELSNSGERIQGGTVEDLHFQLLIKSILALGLGAGDHEISVGFSVSSHIMNEFRRDPSKNALSDDHFDTLAEAVKEIRFRVGNTGATTQVCRVKLRQEEVPVLYETQAVYNVIPTRAQTYALFQIGGGDWQSMLVVDGKPRIDTHKRVSGLKDCVANLRRDLSLQLATAEKAWHEEKKPSNTDGINESGKDQGWVCCKSDKARIINNHIFTNLPDLINTFRDYPDRIKSIIVSGGAVHDDTFLEVLREQVPNKYKIFTIVQFRVSEPDDADVLMDPSFTCAFGIQSTGVKVGLDIGNAYLKGVFNV